MGDRRYLAFDIETAKALPDKIDNILAYRPLGIACAAAFALDSGEQFTWHGTSESGSPTAKMSQAEAYSLVTDLERFVADGYTLVTWNGMSFDFDVLAEESGARARCSQLALNHVDMMFHVVCSQGHYLKLQTAAVGMSLTGKLSNISGADAPRMWANGKYEQVLAYNVQDVHVTAELAAAGDREKTLCWITQRGKRTSIALPNGWLSVSDAQRLPVPDTSWMTSPPRREEILAWAC